MLYPTQHKTNKNITNPIYIHHTQYVFVTGDQQINFFGL